MYGFSVFLNEPIPLSYMEKMYQSGFKGMFTSIHIPEDDDSKYLKGLQNIGAFAKGHDMELVVDISGSALEKLGVRFSDLTPLKEMGLTGLRIDYGISMSEVAKVSQQMDVALNASTISEKDLEELKANQADFSRMEAWHNYYPRPETGLEENDFQKQNKWLKGAGFQVMAFVPGDGEKRGPVHAGLPTLEKHREQNSLSAALEMQQNFFVDKVYIGDPDMLEQTQEQFASYIKEDTILFHAIRLTSGADRYIDFVAGKHTNRMDSARDVIRSAEARTRITGPVEEGNSLVRSIGSITIDNDLYGRYAGEVQITKKNLQSDERVNVLGRIDENELSLLEFCRAGQKFEIRWEE